MKKKYSKDQIMVLIGACLFQCAMIGVLINCSGVLFAQIRQEMGFSMSKISVYNTIKSVATAASAAYVTALFFRANKARFLLVNQLAIIAGFLLIIFDAEGIFWYASAVLIGVASCIGSVAVPMLLSQWFPGNAGTATGIAMAFSGIGGALCNPLCARLITARGWKWAIVLLGLIMIAMTVPGLYLMFRKPVPEEAAAAKKEETTALKTGRGNFTAVLLVCLTLLGGGMGVTFAINISMYAQSIGYSLAVGASLTTMIMLGNVGSKFIYGLLCDRIGVWKATMLTLAAAIASLGCFLLAQNQLAVLMGAALLYGGVYALAMVAISRCCISAYGQQESKHYLGIHTCVNSVVMAGASLLLGFLVDYTNGFTAVLLVTLGAMVCSLAAAWAMDKIVKNRKI